MRFFSFLFFFSLIYSTRGQSVNQINFDKKIDFLLYLTNNNQISDANYFVINTILDSNLTVEQKDTLLFFSGMSNFKLKDYSTSNSFLTKVSDKTNLIYKAKFYSVASLAKTKNYDKAINNLNDLDVDFSPELSSLKNFELAGIYILKDKANSYELLEPKLYSTDSLLQKEIFFLKENYKSLINQNKKSPFKAGLLSAIVPGLGKVYTGNKGQALSAFIRVAALGVMTYDSYLKLGINNPQTIIFGSLFSAFYFGNILGSALSVQIVKNEKKNEINHNILVGLQIPIDYFFE